jgi:hypothetical protein
MEIKKEQKINKKAIYNKQLIKVKTRELFKGLDKIIMVKLIRKEENNNR